jgi:hypothetical protein
MMNRNDEIKNIMRKLRECKKDGVKNESLTRSINEDADTENDASEADLLLARLEDILARFEKVIAVADGSAEEDETEEPAEEEESTEETEEPAEEPAEEEPAEEEPAEEEAAEESYDRSLEARLAALERRFTESRRRRLCSRFTR